MLGLGIGIARTVFNLLTIVKDGLQMWLTFEKDGTDKSPNTNNATLKTGKCLDFDGVNDYIDVDGLSLSGTDATFAFWMKPDASTEYIFDADTTRFIIGFNSNQLSLFDNSAWHQFGSITLSTWQRCVISINGTTAKCYVDGVQLGSDKTINSINLSSPTQVAIGSFNNGGGSHYNGLLSDFQIWDSNWVQADVDFDYDNPQHLVTDRVASSITLSNLKGYWHLSEGAGAINYDSSGQGNNGTISGATWSLTQDTIPQLGLMDWAKSTPVADEITLISDPNDPANDILNNAVRLREHGLNLDGDGYAEVADDNTLDMSNITVSTWVYVTEDLATITANKAVIGKWSDPSSGRSWQIQFNAGTNTLDWMTNDADTLTATGLVVGWNYITCILDTSTGKKIRIDGSTVASNAYSTGVTITTTPVRIGAYTEALTSKSDDIIDESIIYNRALDDAEDTKNYKAGLNQHKAGSSFSDDYSSDYGF